MSDKTKIEWTDATWNIINGCTVVSPGCTNCYAMRLAATRLKNSDSRAGLARMHNGHPQWTGEVSLNKKVSLDPLKWSRPRRIFVCAHGDLFHDAVPDHWIDFVFNVMFLAPQHTYQVLTKRPARMRQYMQQVLDETEEQTAYRFAVSMLHAGLDDTPKDKLPLIQWPPPNAWLGTSVEDQERAEERIPLLLDMPAAVRWLSCEPLLGPVDLARWMEPVHHHPDNRDRSSPAMLALLKAARAVLGGGIDWVAAGGESGPGARPMHPDWARSLRDQCSAAGVPFLMKQWGDWHPSDQHDCDLKGGIMAFRGDGSQEWTWKAAYWAGEEGWQGMCRVGKRIAGRMLDGRQHDGYPA